MEPEHELAPQETPQIFDDVASFGWPLRRIYDQVLEVVQAALGGQMPAANAAELLSGISAQESLQQVLVDALWLAGFAATQAPGSKEAREEFTAFCLVLEKEGVVSKQILAGALEIETARPRSPCRQKHILQ